MYVYKFIQQSEFYIQFQTISSDLLVAEGGGREAISL
jgi:hypothetical protein